MTEQDAPESPQNDEMPAPEVVTPDGGETATDADTQVFSRSYVERLRDENAKLRVRAQGADELRHRLHRVLVEQTGRLADPADLEYADEHLTDPDALAAAIDTLLEAKPHLRSRTPRGDVGQGNRGPIDQPASLLRLLKGVV